MASSTLPPTLSQRKVSAAPGSPLSDSDPSLNSYAPSESSVTDPTDSSGDEKDKSTDKAFVDPFPDFLWMTTEEPHRSRRMAILKAHPEVSCQLSANVIEC